MAFRILDLRCGGQHDYEAFKTHAEGLSRRFTYLIYIIRIRACARTYYIRLREREKPFGKKIRGLRESQRDVFPDVGIDDGTTAAAPLEDYKRILGCRYSPKVAILFLKVHPYLHLSCFSVVPSIIGYEAQSALCSPGCHFHHASQQTRLELAGKLGLAIQLS